MKPHILAIAILGILFCTNAYAQQPQMSPEETQKRLDEFIEKEINKFETQLKMEDWQVFYMDSIFVHNYKAMQAEFDDLMSKKVSNADLYYNITDKWNEKTYNAIKAILNENQWAKYLKMGAGKEKKARDKRKEKAGK